MRPIGEKGFILGGLVILLAVYSTAGAKTLIPTYAKIAGGVFLIAYGIFRLLSKKQ